MADLLAATALHSAVRVMDSFLAKARRSLAGMNRG
jgi:hypothetical protein